MSIFKKSLGAAALLLASAVAASAFPATATTSLNVRSGPGTGYPVIDTLQPGETVEVTSSSGSWYRIDGGGWASANYLAGGSRGAYREPVYTEDYYDYGYSYGPGVYIGSGWGYYNRPWRGHRWHHHRPHGGKWHGHRPGKWSGHPRPGKHYQGQRPRGGQFSGGHRGPRGGHHAGGHRGGGGGQKWVPRHGG